MRFAFEPSSSEGESRTLAWGLALELSSSEGESGTVGDWLSKQVQVKGNRVPYRWDWLSKQVQVKGNRAPYQGDWLPTFEPSKRKLPIELTLGPRWNARSAVNVIPRSALKAGADELLDIA